MIQSLSFLCTGVHIYVHFHRIAAYPLTEAARPLNYLSFWNLWTHGRTALFWLPDQSDWLKSKDYFNRYLGPPVLVTLMTSWHLRSRIHECTVSLRFLGIILRVLRLEVSVHNVYITNQFQTSFAQGRVGVKSLVEVTVNSKDENSWDVCPNYI